MGPVLRPRRVRSKEVVAVKQSIAVGDVVTLNGRRGRVVRVGRSGAKLRVRLTQTQAHGAGASTYVECLAREVHHINSWWNTPGMRAAFPGGARKKHRTHLGRGACGSRDNHSARRAA